MYSTNFDNQYWKFRKLADFIRILMIVKILIEAITRKIVLKVKNNVKNRNITISAKLAAIMIKFFTLKID